MALLQAPRRRFAAAVIAGLGASAVIVTLALRCAHGGDREKSSDERSAGGEQMPASVEPPSSAIAAKPEPPAIQPATPANPTDAATPASPPPDNAIARALHATDARD